MGFRGRLGWPRAAGVQPGDRRGPPGPTSACVWAHQISLAHWRLVLLSVARPVGRKLPGLEAGGNKPNLGGRALGPPRRVRGLGRPWVWLPCWWAPPARWLLHLDIVLQPPPLSSGLAATTHPARARLPEEGC